MRKGSDTVRGAGTRMARRTEISLDSKKALITLPLSPQGVRLRKCLLKSPLVVSARILSIYIILKDHCQYIAVKLIKCNSCS